MKGKNNAAVAYCDDVEVEVEKKAKGKPKLTVLKSPRQGEGTKRKNTKEVKSTTAKSVVAKKTSSVPVLDESQIENLIIEHRENGRKLARSILRRWRVRMPSDEIDSIVDLGLCEAARRFSPDRGASFMTFYFYHLRGHLVRSVTRASQASSMFLNYGQTGGTDTLEWRNIGRESNWNYMPENFLLGQREAETPEHQVLRKEKISECQKAVTKLDDLEREIIVRCFVGEEPLVQIARELGYSRCHVSRVKKSALDRLKLLMDESLVPVDQITDYEEMATRSRNSVDRKRSRRRRTRQSEVTVESTERRVVNA